MATDVIELPKSVLIPIIQFNTLLNQGLCPWAITCLLVWTEQLLPIRVSRLQVSSNISCNISVRLFTHSLTVVL